MWIIIESCVSSRKRLPIVQARIEKRDDKSSQGETHMLMSSISTVHCRNVNSPIRW